MTVEQFFTRYAALSMGEDERALAAMYGAELLRRRAQGQHDVRE